MPRFGDALRASAHVADTSTILEIQEFAPGAFDSSITIMAAAFAGEHGLLWGIAGCADTWVVPMGDAVGYSAIATAAVAPLDTDADLVAYARIVAIISALRDPRLEVLPSAESASAGLRETLTVRGLEVSAPVVEVDVFGRWRVYLYLVAGPLVYEVTVALGSTDSCVINGACFPARRQDRVLQYDLVLGY